MFYKICGAMLIIFSSAMLGYDKAIGYKKRVRYLEDMENGLVLLENEIRYTQTPIPIIIRKMFESCKSELKTVFYDTYNEIAKHDGCNLKDIWKDIVQKNANLFFKDDNELLSSFSECFNNSDVDGQIKIVKVYSEKIAYAIETAREECEKNIKLYKSLSLYVGILLSVLLI